jgi:hypothetical protein
MADSLTPTEGARFLLEREESDDAQAVYRTRIYTPQVTYEGTATLRDDGTATLTEQVEQAATDSSGGRTSHKASQATAPQDLVDMLQMLAKLTARSASKKREDGLPPWPARVLRWRGPGRGE